MASNAAKIIVLAIIIGVVVPIGIAVTDPVEQQLPEGSSGTTTQKDVAALLNGNGVFVDVPGDSGTGTNEIVRDSRNFSLRFTGASDSNLQGNAAFNLGSKTNWTAGTGIWVNDSAVGNDNMTVLAAGDPDLILRYRNRSGASANFSAHLIGPTYSHVINVSAPDPTNSTYIFIQRNGSNVTIYRHNSTDSEIGETINTSTDSTFDGNLTSDANFNGRLDETRFWNKSLTSTERTSIADDPVAPYTGGNRTARLMYDAGSGTDIRIYFAPTAATASNVSYATGYLGEIVSESGDYDWRTDGPEIAPNAGGKLDSSPVAFVVYDLNPDDVEFEVGGGIADAYKLMALVPLILISALLIRHVKKKY